MSTKNVEIRLSGPNRLGFFYIQFKSCDQFPDKISFDFSNILHAMQSYALSAKGCIISKLPKSMIT